MKTFRFSDPDDQAADVYQRRQIEKGLADARAGKLVDYEKVNSDWMKRLGNRPSS
jgi:predicted transcriptional regulator